jgi:hypothetical protein
LSVYLGSILTIEARPVIPIYLRLWDSLLRNLDTVFEAASINDYEGYIIVLHFRH